MKLRVVTLAAACLFVSSIANAEKVDPGTTGSYDPAGGCDTTDMKVYSGSGAAIPDCDFGVTLGPVMTPADGSTFDSAILNVDMFHTWTGDLIVNLYYDAECDGAPEVGPISALCRAGLDGCPDAAVGDCCGISDDVGGSYLFGDDGALSMELAAGPGFLAPGCYALDPDSALPMAALNGVLKGGCFTLHVEDGACADTGIVEGWAVYSANGGGGTPVEESSWSALKDTF